MNRRRFMVAAGAALALPARAHHGWSAFDEQRPLYLAGRVAKVQWANPHVELDLAVPVSLALPADLAKRALPSQSAPVDGPSILARATLPGRKAPLWRVELAPLPRMEAWRIERLAEGETIEVVGFGFADTKPGAVLRAEYLFRGGRAYGLRSSPA